MLLFPVSYLLGLLLVAKPPQISASELQQAMDESAEYVKAATVERDFVIVKSTVAYREARRIAMEAARRLDARLDLRHLSPHRNLGLTFSRKECEDSAFDYPCYVARGRGDDGFYVSVEYSTAYVGFRPGLYIVIVASDEKDGQVARDAAAAAKKLFKDTYVRRTGVYMGCIH